MRSLVIYDSTYGNTRAVAEAVGVALGPEARVLHADQARPDDLDGVGLLIAGSPTQGGRPTAAVKRWIEQLPAAALRGVPVAAFDTRFAKGTQNAFVRLVMTAVGNAAPRMTGALKSKGGTPACPPEGFIVVDKTGPLREGELERAADWASRLVQTPQR